MAHKGIILAIALLAATALPATTYTVKAGGGGDFTTITACKNAMAAGDTCVVYAGDYSAEGVITLTAGTTGNYKTLTVNGTDVVTVIGFVMASHAKIIGNCNMPNPPVDQPIGTCGFSITRPSAPSSNACVSIPANTTDWYITANTMYACGSGAAIYEGVRAGISFGRIQKNTITYTCSTSAAPNVCEGLYINGDNHLIELNSISHVSDAVTNFGVNNVYRTNYMHDTGPGDCGSNSSNCHIDFIESEPVTTVGRPMQYNLYEGNIQRRNPGGNGHTFLTQADGCQNLCFGVIIRFNDVAHVGTYFLINDNAGTTSVNGFYYDKLYNNTVVDFGVANNVTEGNQSGSRYSSNFNNIYYYPSSITVSPYYIDSSSLTGATWGNNLAWCTGTCTFSNHTCYSCSSPSFTTDAGNKIANPLFVSYASDNFQLSSTSSPAYQAGTFLTTTVGAGTGSTSLTVVDATFFQDGKGLTADGVQPDWIRLGSTNTVQISSINYSTNVITLASATNWNSGDGVYLYKDSRGNIVLNGPNPDMGAYPFVSAGTPVATFAPATLTYSGQNVGTTSAGQTTTLTNSGTATLSITNVVMSGAFAISGGTCVGTSFSLTAGNSCTFIVTFTPTVAGTNNGSLQIFDNASGSPHSVPLTGTGLAPVPSWNISSYSYSGISILTNAFQTFTLTNNGTATLNVALTITGSATFTQSATTCGGTLTVGNSCTVTVKFTPTAQSVYTGTLVETDSTYSLTSNLTLSGNGVITPAVTPSIFAWSIQ